MSRTCIALLLFLLPLGAQAAPSVEWQADLVHSRAQFTVSHLVVSKVWGHIPIQSLTIVNKGGSIVPQRIDAVLNVSREDTDNHDRDRDLRSATYFDVAQYPTMEFHSTSITPVDATSFRVTGNLTIKNVTKPVTFVANLVGVIPEGKGWRVGYESDLDIDRREWGIVDARLTAAGVLLVGYKVDIGLTVEATTNDPGLHRTSAQ
ncbi:MAG TPA: YceI family protein [Candidatus Cybelea sp.]|nr:YceI family protein [Candidatus Cybelea sp.]